MLRWLKRRRGRSTNIVVYTAIAGGYDTVKPQPRRFAAEGRFVAFVDDPAAVSRCPPWSVYPFTETHPDPCRTAKRYKVLPHQLFPDADYSLWIDGNVTLRLSGSLCALIEEFLDDVDLCVFRHPQRSCLFAEAEVCKQQRLDDPSLIDAQVTRYRSEGVPENLGLVEASVLLRRHSSAIATFNEAWWNEIKNGSRRDQISFNYVAYRQGLRYGEFPGTIFRGGSQLFFRQSHVLPRRTFG
jgi:hypothetical protein